MASITYIVPSTDPQAWHDQCNGTGRAVKRVSGRHGSFAKRYVPCKGCDGTGINPIFLVQR